MKTLEITMQVITVDSQNVTELVEALGECLEQGMQEATWDTDTLAEDVGISGNVLTLQCGEVVHEVCL